MTPIYENSSFIRNKRFHLTDKVSVAAREREETSVKWTKVLLIVLAVSLGFALGGICALSLLYAGKLSLCDTQQHNVSNTPADPVQKSIGLCELCEEGWTAFGGKCYFFFPEKQTWMKSHNSCTTLNAHLVTINRRAVHDFLVSKIKCTHWIGLNDRDTEGRWVWMNNQTLEDTGLKLWYKTEPNNLDVERSSEEDCACLGYENSYLNDWFDASCESEKKFICEK